MSRVYQFTDQDRTNKTHKGHDLGLLKLDLGCGGRGTMYSGFIGIDKHPEPEEQRTPGAVYIQLDILKDPLPWPESSADEIVCFHVIEHLERSEGVELLRKIHCLLKPGCTAYVSCPDARFFIEQYLQGNTDFFNQTYPKNGKPMWEGRTLLDKLFYSMYDKRDYGHRTPYDVNTLYDAAVKAGWTKIKPLPHGRDGGERHFWCRRPDHECGLILTK